MGSGPPVPPHLRICACTVLVKCLLDVLGVVFMVVSSTPSVVSTTGSVIIVVSSVVVFVETSDVPFVIASVVKVDSTVEVNADVVVVLVFPDVSVGAYVVISTVGTLFDDVDNFSDDVVSFTTLSVVRYVIPVVTF